MFRYSMTLRGGNPQALMLPGECLHHYHVDAHPDAAVAVRPGARVRLGQWLRSFVRSNKPAA